MKTNTVQIQNEREGYADRRRGSIMKSSLRVIWKSKSRHIA